MLYEVITGSVDKITKASGLYDVGISATQYFPELNFIVIGYENGNIDVVTESEVKNVSDIKRKNIASDKQIYSIAKYGNYAYLACGFGIVKLDVENAEITDSYFIGDNAAYVIVNDVAIVGASYNFV